jgi:AcrR family transcriptional regulator
VAGVRWGLDARSESLGANERLLDAALRCYEKLGVQKTTVEDIAQEAQITRRTVYRYFKGHKSILYAVVDREMLKSWDLMLRDLSHIDDFLEFLIESFFYIKRYAAEAKTTPVLFSRELMPLVYDVHLSRPELLETVSNLLRPAYQRAVARGNTRANIDLFMVAEWFTRIQLSYLSTPSPLYKTDEQMRKVLSQMMGPVLSEI